MSKSLTLANSTGTVESLGLLQAEWTFPWSHGNGEGRYTGQIKKLLVVNLQKTLTFVLPQAICDCGHSWGRAGMPHRKPGEGKFLAQRDRIRGKLTNLVNVEWQNDARPFMDHWCSCPGHLACCQTFIDMLDTILSRFLCLLLYHMWPNTSSTGAQMEASNLIVVFFVRSSWY